MSVLFKALQRAEKIRSGDAAGTTNEATEAASPRRPAVAMPALGATPKRRLSPARLLVRGLGLSFIVSMAVSIGAMMLFPDEVEDAFSTLVMGGPTPQPRPPVPQVVPPVAAPQVAEQAPEAAPEPAVEPATVTGAEPGTAPEATPGTTTDIATLMAAARAVQRQKDEAAPAQPPTTGAGERGDPVRLSGLNEAPADEAAAANAPPERRSLEDTLADRARAQQARAVAAPVVVDRPEARRAGAGDAVTVDLPSLRSRDTVADAYRSLLRGDYHAALASYEAVLEEDPRSLQALLGRAAALHKLRRLDEARLAYERVLAADAGNREALTNLLAIIAAAAPQEALGRLHALERTAPGFTPVLAQIALVYGQMGAGDQAIAYLQKAVAQDPANVAYRYNLAVLLDRAGQGAAAAQAYRAVLDGLRAQGAGGGGESGLSADRIKARLDYLIAAR